MCETFLSHATGMKYVCSVDSIKVIMVSKAARIVDIIIPSVSANVHRLDAEPNLAMTGHGSGCDAVMIAPPSAKTPECDANGMKRRLPDPQQTGYNDAKRSRLHSTGCPDGATTVTHHEADPNVNESNAVLATEVQVRAMEAKVHKCVHEIGESTNTFFAMLASSVCRSAFDMRGGKNWAVPMASQKAGELVVITTFALFRSEVAAFVSTTALSDTQLDQLFNVLFPSKRPATDREKVWFTANHPGDPTPSDAVWVCDAEMFLVVMNYFESQYFTRSIPESRNNAPGSGRKDGAVRANNLRPTMKAMMTKKASLAGMVAHPPTAHAAECLSYDDTFVCGQWCAI